MKNEWKKNPTNTQRQFHVKTTWNRPFPRRFNVEYMCVFVGKYLFRGSRSQMYFKIGLLKNFAGVYSCRPVNLLKWDIFFREMCETFKNIFFLQNILGGCFRLFYQNYSVSLPWNLSEIGLWQRVFPDNFVIF